MDDDTDEENGNDSDVDGDDYENTLISSWNQIIGLGLKLLQRKLTEAL